MHIGISWWLSGKKFSVSTGDTRVIGSSPESGRFPCRSKWQPTPVFLHGKSHGQRSLTAIGYESMSSQRVRYNYTTYMGMSTYSYISINLWIN